MKALYAAAAAVALLATHPLLAADDASIDVGELSCEQFNAYNDDNRGLIMMWFEGYYTEEDEPGPSTSAKWRATSPSS
jgi:HdeA/HdeB family protein